MFSSSSDGSIPRIVSTNRTQNTDRVKCIESHPISSSSSSSLVWSEFVPSGDQTEYGQILNRSVSHCSTIPNPNQMEYNKSEHVEAGNNMAEHYSPVINLYKRNVEHSVSTVPRKPNQLFLSTTSSLAKLNLKETIPSLNLKQSPTENVQYRFNGYPNFNQPTTKPLETSFSTPASPTRFIQHSKYVGTPEPMYPSNCNPLENMIHNLNYSKLVDNLNNSGHENSHVPTNRITNQSNEKSNYLNKIIDEISNRLQDKLEYPIIIMPNNQKNQNNAQKSLPLVFQVPHPDTVFVGLPGTSNSNPRIVAASSNNSLVILPLNENKQMTSENKDKQSIVLTGPRPGHLLVITPDNKYQYVPQS